MTGTEFKNTLLNTYYISTESNLPEAEENAIWDLQAQIYGNDFATFIGAVLDRAQIEPSDTVPNITKRFRRDIATGRLYDTGTSVYSGFPMLWRRIAEIEQNKYIAKYPSTSNPANTVEVRMLDGDIRKMTQAGSYSALEMRTINPNSEVISTEYIYGAGFNSMEFWDGAATNGNGIYIDNGKNQVYKVNSSVGATQLVLPQMFTKPEYYVYVFPCADDTFKDENGKIMVSSVSLFMAGRILDGSTNLVFCEGNWSGSRAYSGALGYLSPTRAGTSQMSKVYGKDIRTKLVGEIEDTGVIFPQEFRNIRFEESEEYYIKFYVLREYVKGMTTTWQGQVPIGSPGLGKKLHMTLNPAKSGGHITNGWNCNVPTDREAQTTLGSGGNGGHGGGGGAGCASGLTCAGIDRIDIQESDAKLIGKRYGYGSGGGKGGKAGDGLILVFY